LEYLISPNGTVFIGPKINRCSEADTIYFYDYDLVEKDGGFYAAPGCIEEFSYIDELNYFVWVNYCDGTILFFEDDEDDVEWVGTCTITEPLQTDPYSFAYSDVEDLGYCSADGSYYYFYSIDLDDFTSNEIDDDVERVKAMFYNSEDEYVYGISSNTIYKIGEEVLEETYPLAEAVDLNDNFNRDDDYILNEDDGFLYLPITDDEGYINSKKILKVKLSNGDNELISTGLSYQKSIQVIFPNKGFSLFGKSLAWYADKQNLFCGQMYFSNSTLITTHAHSRTLTGDWDWISFPCMPRLGNEGFGSEDLLEELNSLPDELTLETREFGQMQYLSYDNPYWDTDDIPYLISTQGYKYNSDPTGSQSLDVTGVVLDPATPIQLSSSYENWIGYFLEYPLDPEDAFVRVWDKLTRISTHDWTMVKINGRWVWASTITPIDYGDGLIVTVSEDCELIWDYASEPAENFAYPSPEYYSYQEKAEYTPFYFEMDSMTGVTEIGLTVNDSCVGAAVVEPGDSIVEVNAYLAGMPSGVPIEVETWNGYKSAGIGSEKYSVVNPYTKKRISRKVYTGERKAFYIISFKAGENPLESPVVVLQPPSPNPFSYSTLCSFVLKHSATLSLSVHDLRGNKVSTLMTGTRPEGYYEAGWTGTDASGNHVKNGIYIIRLSVDDRIILNEKVVFIR